MKPAFSNFKTCSLSLAALLLAGHAAAANTLTTVAQVSSPVTLNIDVDYHITGTTPFAAGGSINITNTDHAVIIFDNIKPSRVLNLLSSITINGQKAVNNSTCQVKVYDQGAIVLPYGADIKPLTVYSEQNYKGTAVNDFGLENTGGYMNTLTDAKLNNKIRSFKLKRGYMVTFSTRAKGRGYSRCFIADTEDLEFASMPAILDKSITSYRIFKWNDVGKKGLANDTRNESNNALNTSWCYSFGLGENTGVDRECVPMHVKEGWPSPASCGSVTYSPHLKTNNEPQNPADDPKDNPESLEACLSDWEDLMATGMRLCTPSSWDGSWNFNQQFLNEIDARGWRCDILDVHSYWPDGSFPQLQTLYNNGKRPIWVTEWCWGASWNNNGVFSRNMNDATAAQQNAVYMKKICEMMNGYGFVERYAYWNSEQDRSKVYLNGQLTEAGKYYANMHGGVGYNKKYDYVPTIPKSKGVPTDLSAKYNAKSHEAVLTWHEFNGEYNKSMVIERRRKGESGWTVVQEVELQEQEADYSVVDKTAQEEDEYRIHVVYADNRDLYTSNTAIAVRDQVLVGDPIVVDGKTYYVGGNLLTNGSFDYGTRGWLNGNGNEIAQPDFKVFSQGGYDGGTYLQAFSNETAKSAGSVNTPLLLKSNAMYYFSGASKQDGITYNQLTLVKEGSRDSMVVDLPSGTVWNKYGSVFSTGTYSNAVIALKWLGATAQFDQFGVYPLFEKESDAVADGIAAEQKRAQWTIDANQAVPALNSALQTAASQAKDEESLNVLTQSVDNTLKAVASQPLVDSLKMIVSWYGKDKLPGYQKLQSACAAVEQENGAEAYLAAVGQLKALVNQTVVLTDGNLVNGSQGGGYWLNASTVKTASLTQVTQAGVKSEQASWKNIPAQQGEQATMEMRQQILGRNNGEIVLNHGLYVLDCKAGTEHYCLTDQRLYMASGNDSVVSPVLTKDFMDIPNFTDAQKWQTLSTPAIYLNDGDTLNVGFVGSKKGAVDKAWKPFGDDMGEGDLREGSWWATDFTLRYLPVYRKTMDGSGWSTLCLPYAFKAGDDFKLYEIAGVSTDQSKIYIRPVAEAAAGVPVIIRSDAAVVSVPEQGTKVEDAEFGVNGLEGRFITNAAVAKNGLVFRNGRWIILDTNTRNDRLMDSYSAYIRSLSDVPVLDAWDGEYLPLATFTGVDKVEADQKGKADYYTLDGKKTGSVKKNGVYVRKANGKTKKVTIK